MAGSIVGDRIIDVVVELRNMRPDYPHIECIDRHGRLVFAVSFSSTGLRATFYAASAGTGDAEVRSSFFGRKTKSSRLHVRIELVDDAAVFSVDKREMLRGELEPGTCENAALKLYKGCWLLADETSLHFDWLDERTQPVSVRQPEPLLSQRDRRTSNRSAQEKRLLRNLSGFAATRQFPKSIPILLYGDEARREPMVRALLELFPLSTIHVIAPSKGAPVLEAAIGKHATARVKFVTETDFEKALTGDDVLVVGEGVVESGLLSRLVPQKPRLHLMTLEAAPKPVGEIDLCGSLSLGNILVAVEGREGWCFNRHEKGQFRKWRLGLDIVVAMYNAKNYIVQCIDSLLVSGRPDIRIVVVNDGSTDGSDALVAARYGGNPSVTLVTKPNGGCASARNYGWLISDASHITFVDADDFVDEGFFSALFDLALYTGDQVVQGGFDFYDESAAVPFQVSYEKEQFQDLVRSSFDNHKCIRIDAKNLIPGQPTIWRRVYRRDFLESNRLTFPENIRAFDDYIFHVLTTTYSGSLHMLTDLNYHYRQHPDQDIKQADERHFNVLYMFRQMIRRSIEEGWSDFTPYVSSIIRSMAFSINLLEGDNLRRFLNGSVQICAVIVQIYGETIIREDVLTLVDHPDFVPLFREAVLDLSRFPKGAHWTFLNDLEHHPELIRMNRCLEETTQ